MSTATITQRDALRLYCAAIGGNEPRSSLSEIRWRQRPGEPMHAQFMSCQALGPIVERVTALAARGEVFLGAAPRHALPWDGRRRGSLLDAVGRSRRARCATAH